MDQKYIDTVADLINKSDIPLKRMEIRGVTYEDDKKKTRNMELIDYESYGGFRLSDSWIIENMILFSLFDGYVEENYGLQEGDSFRNHYKNLPSGTTVEEIQKNCYRIMKLMRNAITHNLSKIQADANGYDIQYVNRHNQTFRLKITKEAVQFLYTIIMMLVTKKCDIQTEGHFKGVLSYYDQSAMKGISVLEDEFGIGLQQVSGLPYTIRSLVRHRINNPRIEENTASSIKFKKYNPGYPDFPCDYVWKEGGKTYLIPEEIMTDGGETWIIARSELTGDWEWQQASSFRG